MKYWKITPHQDSSYDDCIMPAETEEDNIKAFSYAHDRLEGIWDSMEVGQKNSVTMELCEDDNEQILKLIKESE